MFLCLQFQNLNVTLFENIVALVGCMFYTDVTNKAWAALSFLLVLVIISWGIIHGHANFAPWMPHLQSEFWSEFIL